MQEVPVPLPVAVLVVKNPRRVEEDEISDERERESNSNFLELLHPSLPPTRTALYSRNSVLPVTRSRRLSTLGGAVSRARNLNSAPPSRRMKILACPLRSEEHTSELQSLRHLVC